MKKAMNWVIAISIVACLIVAFVYQTKHTSIKLVEAMSDINTSVIHPKNPGCKITTPDGIGLDLKNIGVVIPKGTFITSECFGIK
jgi:hypothetical protein